MAKKPSRKVIPNGVRFDVFKRDKFTCQYCGKSAPEVVLNCDHIHPVKEGGTSDPLNLITSCFDCNSGKGAKTLSDSTAIDRQSAQLAQLEERRQQIDMMLEWRKELGGMAADAFRSVLDACDRGGFKPSPETHPKLRAILKKYGLSAALVAIDESFDTYLVDGELESWEKAYSKISVFANLTAMSVDKPYMRKVLYIQGILRNRFGVFKVWKLLEYLHLQGYSLDGIEAGSKDCPSFNSFLSVCDRSLAADNKPPFEGDRSWQ